MTLNTDTQPISLESQTTVVEIAPWRDALAVGGIRADSDDALLTGREAIFDRCECTNGGAR